MNYDFVERASPQIELFFQDAWGNQGPYAFTRVLNNSGCGVSNGDFRETSLEREEKSRKSSKIIIIDFDKLEDLPSSPEKDEFLAVVPETRSRDAVEGKLDICDLTVLPEMTFYPVHWREYVKLFEVKKQPQKASRRRVSNLNLMISLDFNDLLVNQVLIALFKASLPIIVLTKLINCEEINTRLSKNIR